MYKVFFISLPLLALLVACNMNMGQEGLQETASSAAQALSPQIQRSVNGTQVASGGGLYRTHCAECHGVNGEGAPGWRERGENGKYPAPPLNGDGHTWHHPLGMLRHVIKSGTPGGQGDMPAWEGKLSDPQIDDIIAWMQSRWPDEQYIAWKDINDQSRKQ